MAKATTPTGSDTSNDDQPKRAVAKRPPKRAPKAGSQRLAERARGGEARRIADYVPAIGDTSFRKFGFVQSSIVMRWPEIVGPKLARVTSPESLRFPQGKKSDGVLHICVSGAQATIVQHILPDIIARVNQFFGYAAVARVQISPRRPARPTASSTQMPQLPVPTVAPLPPLKTVPLSSELNRIADPELRAVLEGLAGSMANRARLPKVS